MLRPPLVLLVGPTAVGKTGLSLELARRAEAEIVGADSVQVYQGLDIGSAKPTAAERATVRHHLVDVLDPCSDFSAAQYARLAEKAIADIARRGKRALVVGGTGLYLRALLYSLAPAPPVDRDLRDRLAEEWRQKGGTALHRRLAQEDPEAAARIHPADRQRVLRALEFCLQTGEPFSRRQQAHGFKKARYEYIMIGLTRPRAELKGRIEERCRQMWRQGLAAEVRDLLQRGVPVSAKALGSLGYRQMAAALAGSISQQEALAQTIKDTLSYAKRQLTWFQREKGIVWHHPSEQEAIWRRVAAFWGLSPKGER